jgi:hypothetical protein
MTAQPREPNCLEKNQRSRWSRQRWATAALPMRPTGTRLAMTVVNHANRSTEDPLTSASEEVRHRADRASPSARTF